MCEKVFRPDFEKIKSFEEFSQFYWYRDELILICKKLGLEHNGTKANLIMIIKEYFYGNKILRKKNSKKRKVNVDLDSITLETKLVDCGFSCSQKFREFFSKQVASKIWKHVRESTLPKVYSSKLLKIYGLDI